MLSIGSPHVATAVFPHSLGCRLETIGHNTVTLWKCVGAVIGCGKISITNCGWKQNAILLAYITSGSDSGTFVFTACADMLYICSELSFPGAHNHRHCKAREYFTELIDIYQIVKVHLHLQWDLLQDVVHCSFFVRCL